MLKGLIEVALPLKEVSEQSAREKSIRHGQILTLHIWWSRRPLAACRVAAVAGWDVASPAGGQTDRHIEVKGRACVGGVALTPNEWTKAQRFGKDYWLYVVVNCREKPEIYLIQDPASKLNPKEEVSVV